MNKPDCYKCVHRRNVAGDTHSRCNNFEAKMTANSYGIKSGWVIWPFNFDPIWLETCDGFSDNPKDNKPEAEADPLLELMSMLR